MINIIDLFKIIILRILIKFNLVYLLRIISLCNFFLDKIKVLIISLCFLVDLYLINKLFFKKLN